MKTLSGSERLAMAQAVRKNPLPSMDGDSVRAWRSKLCLTQVALANRLKALGWQATERGVRRWETGESRVPVWLANLRLRDPQLEGQTI